MMYITINIEGKNLHLDIDKKRTACRDCGKMIRFAQDDMGNHYVVEGELLGTFYLHYKRCKKRIPTNLEKNIESEDRNQEFLNSL